MRGIQHISLASCFKCVKHAQHLSVKNSKTQELRYT